MTLSQKRRNKQHEDKIREPNENLRRNAEN